MFLNRLSNFVLKKYELCREYFILTNLSEAIFYPPNSQKKMVEGAASLTVCWSGLSLYKVSSSLLLTFEPSTPQRTAKGNFLWQRDTRSDMNAQREKGQIQNMGRKLLYKGIQKLRERVSDIHGSTSIVIIIIGCWKSWVVLRIFSSINCSMLH